MGEGRGIYSVAMFHVAANDISFAAIFLQKHLSLMQVLLFSKLPPLCWGVIWFQTSPEGGVIYNNIPYKQRPIWGTV